MQVISSLVGILVISTLTIAQLDEVDVIRSEMEPSMEKYAVGNALVLLSGEKDFTVVASKLVDIMNKKYGLEWVVLIGTNLHTAIIGMKLVKSTMLLLEFRDTHVLLVQQELEQIDNTNKTNLEAIIERAKSASVQQIASSNPANFNKFANLAKEVIANDYNSCDKRTDSTDIKNWCYRRMSEALVDAINRLTNSTTQVFSATVGNNNRCFSETLGLNITEAHLFSLADIYFEIKSYTL